MNGRPANHHFSQSVHWIAIGATQWGWTQGAVLPARRSAPEHDPYMTSEHSTAARWIILGVNFEEGGNQSARRNPSKSGWDRLKLNPHTTFVVEVEGVIDVHNNQTSQKYTTSCADEDTLIIIMIIIIIKTIMRLEERSS